MDRLNKGGGECWENNHPHPLSPEKTLQLEKMSEFSDFGKSVTEDGTWVDESGRKQCELCSSRLASTKRSLVRFTPAFRKVEQAGTNQRVAWTDSTRKELSISVHLLSDNTIPGLIVILHMFIEGKDLLHDLP